MTRMLACVMALVFACGCVGLPNWQDTGDYLYDRGNDFVDCFQLNGGVGIGLAANVKVTDLVTLYLGASKTSRVGLGRRYLQAWQETEGGILLIGGRRVRKLYGYGATGERYETEHPVERRRRDYLNRRLSSSVIALYTTLPVDVCDRVFKFFPGSALEAMRRPPIEAANLEVGATLGVVSARVGVSPGQMVDFVRGWFGVDTAGDDRGVGWRAKEEE